MIAIIDFGAGNLHSAYHAFKSFYPQTNIIRHPHALGPQTRGLVLPGDGSFPFVFDRLKRNGFVRFIKENPQLPLLGICVGFQLLFSASEEDGGSEGLGLIEGEVRRFVSQTEKVPHMGWNDCRRAHPSPLITDIPDFSYFYFVHSYFVSPLDKRDEVMRCHYTRDFAAAVQHHNVYGCQFHPEKSHATGWKIIENFVAICRGQFKRDFPC